MKYNPPKDKSNIKFLNNGKLGDITYSLPTIIAMGGGTLYIRDKTYDTQNGPAEMSPEKANKMIEFLKTQPYIRDCKAYNDEEYDYCLDDFRNLMGNEKCNDSIANFCLRQFDQSFDMSQPWLYNIGKKYVADIIINRSLYEFRHGHNIKWNLLEPYIKRCIFYGTISEYNDFRNKIGLNIEFYEPESIVNFAAIINASKLYIGNSSFGFALAEGMKHPRVIELPYLYHENYGTELFFTLPQSTNGHVSISKQILETYLND